MSISYNYKEFAKNAHGIMYVHIDEQAEIGDKVQ